MQEVTSGSRVGKCTDTCLEGYYKNEQDSQNLVCSQCHATCRTCTRELESNCTSCNPDDTSGYRLLQRLNGSDFGRCQKQCDEGYSPETELGVNGQVCVAKPEKE